MKWTFENAKIKGRIVLTDSLHEDPDLLKDKTLYKFIWVDSGEVELDIDHQHVVLKKEQLVPLSHLQAFAAEPQKDAHHAGRAHRVSAHRRQMLCFDVQRQFLLYTWQRS